MRWLPIRLEKSRSDTVQRFVLAHKPLMASACLMFSFRASVHLKFITNKNACMRSRCCRCKWVSGKQRRLPRQTQVHEHGGEHDMRRLSRWVDQRWSEGLRRCFECASFDVLVSWGWSIDFPWRPVFAYIDKPGTYRVLYKAFGLWFWVFAFHLFVKMWTSAWKTTVVATANASASTSWAVIHVAIVQLVGLTMGTRAVKVRMNWLICLFACADSYVLFFFTFAPASIITCRISSGHYW